MFLPKSLKRKIAKEWTAYDLGLRFCSQKRDLKKKIKRLSSKRTRKYLKFDKKF